VVGLGCGGGARELQPQLGAVGQSGEAVVVRLMGDAVNQASVLERRGRVRGHPRQPIEQIGRQLQTPGVATHRHHQGAEEAGAGGDRDDDRGDRAELVEELAQTLAALVLVHEDRLLVGLIQPALQEPVSVRQLAPLGRLEGGVDLAGDHPPADLAGRLVPQVDPHPVAVDDRRNGLGEAVDHLVAGPRGGQRPGQFQQRAGLAVTASGFEQCGGGIQGGRRVACVHLEQLALLFEELGAVLAHGQQAAVVVTVGAHRYHQPGIGQVGG